VDSTDRSEVHRRVQPFAEAVADRGRDLDEMAFALSSVFQPDLDLIGCLASLDQLAASCPTPTRDGVISHLFGSGMFAGDRSDYHHWRNSCLDQVLAARRGMPISLAVVAIEVARRVGVQVVGIGLPGHFLVGDADDRTWFADPFHGRSGLNAEHCRELLLQAGVSRWSDRFLDPTPNRLIIARMLNNLKMSCERSGDVVRLALVMQARQAMSEFAAERDAARLALAPLN
jgi:regulator of sirC expression with transglutaminase-like and TPR domain